MSLAARLNKRVLIQAPPTGQDANGEPLTTWTDFVTDTTDHKVWAEVSDISGREYVAAAAVQNSVQTKILIRYRDGIKASMRVVHGSDIYNIETPLEQGGRTILLMCSKKS